MIHRRTSTKRIMEDVEKWDLRSKKASKKGKCDWGEAKTVFHFRKLFNQGSEEMLGLSERKRGGRLR